MDVQEPVGFWKRFAALLMDSALITILSIVLFNAVTGEWKLDPNPFQGWTNFLIQQGYLVLLPVLWSGYTIGKRALGIRIAKLDGSPVGVGTMLLREPAALVFYGLTFGIGFIASIVMVITRKDRRTVHDLFAKTYVTSRPPK